MARAVGQQFRPGTVNQFIPVCDRQAVAAQHAPAIIQRAGGQIQRTRDYLTALRQVGGRDNGVTIAQQTRQGASLIGVQQIKTQPVLTEQRPAVCQVVRRQRQRVALPEPVVRDRSRPC